MSTDNSSLGQSVLELAKCVQTQTMLIERMMSLYDTLNARVQAIEACLDKNQMGLNKS